MIRREGGRAGGCIGTMLLSDDGTQWVGYEIEFEESGRAVNVSHGPTVLKFTEAAVIMFEEAIPMVPVEQTHKEYNGPPGQEDDGSLWDVVLSETNYEAPLPIRFWTEPV